MVFLHAAGHFPRASLLPCSLPPPFFVVYSWFYSFLNRKKKNLKKTPKFSSQSPLQPLTHGGCVSGEGVSILHVFLHTYVSLLTLSLSIYLYRSIPPSLSSSCFPPTVVVRYNHNNLIYDQLNSRVMISLSIGAHRRRQLCAGRGIYVRILFLFSSLWLLHSVLCTNTEPGDQLL